MDGRAGDDHVCDTSISERVAGEMGEGVSDAGYGDQAWAEEGLGG